jgi:hypothetical protein
MLERVVPDGDMPRYKSTQEALKIIGNKDQIRMA